MAIKSGIYAAAVSVFNEDLSLDISSTVAHADKLLKEGCHGVAIFGSTGAGQLISRAEKEKLIENISSSKIKEDILIGTSDNSFNETVGLMNFSLRNGINSFLMMPPAYYKYGDKEVYSFFSKIIEKVPDSKIILCNFEKLSGYKFSIQIVERLVKDFPKQIVGVKDSSYNLYENLRIPNFLIFPGSETKLLKGLELGCNGIISAACNVTATMSRRVYDDFHNKKEQKFNERLCAVRSIFDNYNLISGIHSFLSIENEKFQTVLPPLSLLPVDKKNELLIKLKELNFLPEKNIAA